MSKKTSNNNNNNNSNADNDEKYIQQFYKFYLSYLEEAKDIKILEFTENSNYFNIMELKLINVILLQTLDELIITNKGKSKYLKQEITQPMKYRFATDPRNKLYMENTVEPTDKNIDKMITIKLENDIEMLRTILEITLKEILELKSYPSLQHLNNSAKKESKDEYNLIIEFINNNNLISYLDKKLKHTVEERQRINKELNNRITTTEDERFDSQMENAIKYRLVCNWEQTRNEQSKILLINNEKFLTEQINDNKIKIDREQISMFEIENYIKFKIEELEKQIDYWIKTYESEMQNLNINIKITNDSINDVNLKCVKLQENYNAQRQAIIEYREFQQIENENRQLEIQKREAAIKIQSWWRGVMVRKQLGPYKPKKKNKKGKGDKQAKGKKK